MESSVEESAFALHWLEVVAFLPLLAAFLLHAHANGALVLRWQTLELAPGTIQPDAQHCYAVGLGHEAWMSAHRGPSVARLLENGMPLGLPNMLHQDVQTSGHGRYVFWADYVHFSTSDGSDPRSNGRRYEVYWPHPVPSRLILMLDLLAVMGVAMLAGSGKAYGQRWNRGRLRAFPDFCRVLAHPLPAATVVGLCALVARLVVFGEMTLHPSRFIDGPNVVGVPFSDARQWDLLGEGVARGEGLTGGWSARRPFYAVFLGLLYTWTGASGSAAILANLLLSALTAALICRVGWALSHPATGLAAGLAFAFDANAINQALTTLSETLGLLLLVLSLYWLVKGGTEARDRHTFGGGVALALSTLTRPVAILAEGAFAVLLVLSSWRRGLGRRASRSPVAFMLGFAVTTAPWLVRQRLVHGVATMSDNSAAVLYAVSSPVHRTWTAAVDQEAEAAGVPPDIRSRHSYFEAALHRNLRERPLVFVSNTRVSVRKAMDGLGRVPWTARAATAIALGLFGLWMARRIPTAAAAGTWAGLVGGLFVTLLALPGEPFLWLGIVGLCALPVASTTVLATIPAIAFATTLLGLGISGLGGEPRMIMTAQWLLPMGATAAGLAALTALGRGLGIPATTTDVIGHDTDPGLTRLRRAFRILSWAAFAWAAATGICLVARTAHPSAPTSPGVPALADEQRLLELILRAHPNLVTASERDLPSAPYRNTPGESLSAAHGRILVVRAFIDRHQYFLPAGLVVSHWARMFADRNYGRTFFYMDGRLADGTTGPSLGIIDGPLPPPAGGRPLLIAGRLNVDTRFPYEELLLEVMAAVPTGTDTRPQWDQAAVVRDREHFALLVRLRNSPAGAATP